MGLCRFLGDDGIGECKRSANAPNESRCLVRRSVLRSARTPSCRAGGRPDWKTERWTVSAWPAALLVETATGSDTAAGESSASAFPKLIFCALGSTKPVAASFYPNFLSALGGSRGRDAWACVCPRPYAFTVEIDWYAASLLLIDGAGLAGIRSSWRVAKLRTRRDTQRGQTEEPESCAAATLFDTLA